MVVQGAGAVRSVSCAPVSRSMVQQSGLRLVEAAPSCDLRSEYEPMEASSFGITPRWLKAMWVASVLVSGLALYWVSLSA